MIRITKYIVVLLVVALAAAWLAANDGRLRVEWLGYIIEMKMLYILPILFIGIYALLLCDRMLRWVLHWPSRMGKHQDEKRRIKGYQALMDGFTAVAAGDADVARKLAVTARRHLLAEGSEAVPLTLLLSAQTAQLDGDQEKARQHYTQMLPYESSEFLGLRGLLLAALRKLPADVSAVPEALQEAIKLAERAYALRPDTHWLVLTLTELYIKDTRWRRAEEAIRRARKKHVLEEIEANRLLAIVHYQQAVHAARQDKTQDALAHAEKAHKERAGFVPATLLLVDLLLKMDAKAKASKTVEKAWAHQPHPQLAECYRNIHAAMTADKRVKQVEKMVKSIPEHMESHVAVALEALHAQQWSKARNHVKAALQTQETTRLCKLMAELEEAEHLHSGAEGESKADKWKKRMEKSQPDPQWICDQCGSLHDRWEALCQHCGSFDSVHWRLPHGTYADAGTRYIQATSLL